MSRIFLKILYIYPVKKNRIYLSSYRGTSLGDNPGYIYRYMRNKYPGQWEYIWEYDGEILDEGTITVSSGFSIQKIRYIISSKIIISNCGLGSYIPKRSSQFFINTWHGGGAYKRVGIDDLTSQNKVENYITKLCGEQTDLFVSSSSKFTQVMSISKLIPEERFLECGMPRNDGIINGIGSKALRKKIYEKYHIQENVKMVLYAPTFRGKEQSAVNDWDIDINACLDALSGRFGGQWIFLVRQHHFVKNREMADCVDTSTYPDMQELLQAVDVLITDYSSSMWDYSFTLKPGFLYAPDINQYSRERSFYTAPEDWPYPVSGSNEGLVRDIESFDWNKNEEKIKKHWELFGNRESGRATEIITEEIIRLCS